MMPTYQMQYVKYLPRGDSEVYLVISAAHLLAFHSCKHIVIHIVTGKDIFTCIKFLLKVKMTALYKHMLQPDTRLDK